MGPHRFAVLALAALLAGPSAALAAKQLYPIAVDGKYGYIDAKGKVVVEPQYDEAHAFREGYASVRVGAAWHFIDAKGTQVDAGGWLAASSFFEGLAAVREDAGVGFIDTTGEIVIEPAWEGAENFADGRSLIRVGAGFGFIDRTGAVVVPPQLPWASSYSEGLAPVSVQGASAGFLGLDGTMAIQEQWQKVGAFREGLAAVSTGSGFSYIDPKGEVVIVGPFEGAADFSGGVAVIKQGGKYGLIDKKGKAITDVGYEAAGNLSGGLVAVKSGGKIGFVNAKGKLVIDHRFDDTHGFDGALAAVREGLLWSYVDAKGKTVWSPAGPALDATAAEALVGQQISHAYYPFMVDGHVVAGALVTVQPTFGDAVAHARVHPEWEVIVPVGGAWAVYGGDRDYLLRELTQTPVDGITSFAVVEVDTTAEAQFRVYLSAHGASAASDLAIAQYLVQNASDWQAPANVPEVRTYGEPIAGLPATTKVHELAPAAP